MYSSSAATVTTGSGTHISSMAVLYDCISSGRGWILISSILCLDIMAAPGSNSRDTVQDTLYGTNTRDTVENTLYYL